MTVAAAGNPRSVPNRPMARARRPGPHDLEREHHGRIYRGAGLDLLQDRFMPMP